jgi:hypothetical protein
MTSVCSLIRFLRLPKSLAEKVNPITTIKNEATTLPTNTESKCKMLADMSHITEIDTFWKSISGKEKPTQLQRYEKKNAPEGIKKFIAIGGGPKMGTTLEQYARFRFKNLQKRGKGKQETGYDHMIKLDKKNILVEQKSSGHWGDDDYKWQHVEDKHKWTMLLLCGIDYTNVKFWGMDRKTFRRLISDKKITNQGNKAGDSSEGMWFNYSDVKDSLVEIQSEEQLLQFASSLEASDE